MRSRTRTDVVLEKAKPLFGVLDVVVKLAYANLLWLGTTALGLVVFGLWPATVALFAAIDDLILHREPVTWRSFLARARAEIVRASLVGWLLAATCFVLAFYLVAAWNQPSVVVRMLQGGLLVLVVLYLCGLLYLLPAMLRTEVRGRKLVTLAGYLVLGRPLHTLSLAVVPAALVVVMVFVVPAALIFFAASAPAYVVLVVAGHALAVRRPSRAVGR